MTEELFLYDLIRGQEIVLRVKHLDYSSKIHQFYLTLEDGRKLIVNSRKTINSRTDVGKLLYYVRDKILSIL